MIRSGDSLPTRRPFADIGELLALVDAFEHGTLRADEWDHRARLGITVVYLLTGSLDEARDKIRALLPSFNRTAGLADDAYGYHETLVTVYLRAVDAGLAACTSESLIDSVNELLAGPFGDPNFATRFYSSERLWSTRARRQFVDPDLRPLPAA